MEISTEKLKEFIQKKKENKEDFILIDVREPEELELYGKIETAINIPLNDFEKTFQDKQKLKILGIDKKKKLVLYCRSGGRSNIATHYLKSKGYNANNYSGSILEWSKLSKDVKPY